MKRKGFKEKFEERQISYSEESTAKATTLVEKGDRLFEQGLYDECIRLYKQAADLDPWQMDELEFIDKGDELLDQGEYAKAIVFYDQALKINDEEELAWFSKGLALQYIEDPRGAIKCFDRAIGIEPIFMDALVARSQSFLASEMYDKAMKSINTAIEINDEMDEAWYFKGNILFAQRRFDDAIVCYDKALKLNPDHVWARSNKAHALTQMGGSNETIKIHKEIKKRCARVLKANRNDPQILIIAGESSMALGDYSAAEEYLLNAIELDPNEKYALARLGILYSEYTFEYEKALEMDRRVLGLDPGDYRSELGLAEDLIGLGDYAEARKYALKVASKAKRAKDNVTECIAKFDVLVSYVLKAGGGEIDAVLKDFLDSYPRLGTGFKIDENSWIFGGLTNAIVKSRANVQTRITLVVLLKILQGEIDGQMRHVIQQMIEAKES